MLYYIFIILFITLILFGTFFIVKQQSAAVVERFGKFVNTRQSGLQIKIPIIDRVAGRLSLRIQQLDVVVETKTKDDVFVKVKVSVQYKVIKDKVYDAFYKLDFPQDQITSYVFDVVRAEVPKMIFSEVLASVEVSNAFDGSYWFVFNKTQDDGTILGDGYGSLLINDGIVTVKKGSKGGYNELGQMSPTFFDNFKGKIDKNGDIVASFTFSLCVGCGLEEKLVMFSGNIKSQKLSGLYHTHEVFFDMR